MADRLTKKERSERMRAVKRANTAPELIVRSILHGLGYRFSLHKAELPGRPDIVMRSRKTVVFVHGCFWHGHSCRHGQRQPIANAEYWSNKISRNKRRDRRVQAALCKLGWSVITVWECRTRSPDNLRRRLSRQVG